MQLDPPSPLRLHPDFLLSLEPRSTFFSLSLSSIIIRRLFGALTRSLSPSLSQGDDGEIGPRGLPGEPVSDHTHYRIGLTLTDCRILLKARILRSLFVMLAIICSDGVMYHEATVAACKGWRSTVGRQQK